MIATIKNPIGWGTITFRFDTYAWITMCEVNKVDELHEIAKLDERMLFITLLFAAHVSHCRYSIKRERYNLEDIYKMYMKMQQQTIDELKVAIYKSKVLGKSLEEWAGDGAEKKK